MMSLKEYHEEWTMLRKWGSKTWFKLVWRVGEVWCLLKW